jgi:hypothetical protein
VSSSSSSSWVTGHIAGCAGLLKATRQEMRVHFPFHPLATEWAASSAGCVPFDEDDPAAASLILDFQIAIHLLIATSWRGDWGENRMGVGISLTDAWLRLSFN